MTLNPTQPVSFDEFALRARSQYREGWSLPAYHYQSAECYANDLARMREQVWFMAGHESQIPTSGDYKLFNFAQESVILVRDKSNAVNAFYNVCRHRGAHICSEARGHLKLLTCPYHGWSYKLDGALLPPANMPVGFDPKEYGLKRCHVETFEGLIFICLATGSPPDFEEFVRRLRPFVRPYAIKHTKVVAEERLVSVSNWKVSIENFAECYHCPGLHADMMRVISPRKLDSPNESGESWSTRMRRLGRFLEPVIDGSKSQHFQQAIQMEGGQLSGTKDGRPCARLLGDMTEWSGGWTLLSFNPFVHALLFDDFVHFLYYLPLDVTNTEATMLWLVREDAVEGVDCDRTALTGLMRQVMLEDIKITDNIQSGTASSAYRPSPLSNDETRIVGFHDWYFRNFFRAG